jgi:murein tripeptide amidase MpaA
MKVFLSVLFLSVSLVAQPQFNSAIPPPSKILGYELGDRFTSHSLIERYIQALENSARDRVRVVPYGQTYEGRSMYLVVFSSPENLQKLEEIKTNIGKLADPRTTSPREVESIVKNNPAIAWLSYGVHGNEASSPEAALNVMYHLAARTDDEIVSLLRNVVVVVDPLLNPDGHERYVNYQLTRRGVKPIEDRNAVEHNVGKN